MTGRRRLLALAMTATFVALVPGLAPMTSAFGASDVVIYCSASGSGAFKPALHDPSSEITTHRTKQGVSLKGLLGNCRPPAGAIPLSSGKFSVRGRGQMLAGNFPPSCTNQHPLDGTFLDWHARVKDAFGKSYSLNGNMRALPITVDGDEIELDLIGMVMSAGPFQGQRLHLYVP